MTTASIGDPVVRISDVNSATVWRDGQTKVHVHVGSSAGDSCMHAVHSSRELAVAQCEVAEIIDAFCSAE